MSTPDDKVFSDARINPLLGAIRVRGVEKCRCPDVLALDAFKPLG
jgi:hypothetical protein